MNNKSRFILYEHNDEFNYNNNNNINIKFNRVAFIFFVFFIISLIYSIHLTHLGSRKSSNVNNNKLKFIINLNELILLIETVIFYKNCKFN